MQSALLRLAAIMFRVKSRKGGIFVFFFDVKRAFGSANRDRLFQDLQAKFPGDLFVKKLKNCYNNLMMKVDLGFISIDEVGYKRGLPEGSCVSA